MARSSATSRSKTRNPLPLRCTCGKRLAIVGGLADGYLNLVAMDVSRYRVGQPFTEHDGEWIGLGCPKCGQSRPFRRAKLKRAWKAAIAAGATSVTVP